MNGHLLAIDDLSVTFRRRRRAPEMRAVDRVTLDLDAGERDRRDQRAVGRHAAL